MWAKWAGAKESAGRDGITWGQYTGAGACLCLKEQAQAVNSQVDAMGD